MAYQNALVGVATAAFYPQLTISGGGGLQSTSIASLVTAPSVFWSLGGDLLQPVFERRTQSRQSGRGQGGLR